MRDFEQNIAGGPSQKCPCGKRGRFKLYIGNGVMLCLDDMQYWLSENLKAMVSGGKPESKEIQRMINNEQVSKERNTR